MLANKRTTSRGPARASVFLQKLAERRRRASARPFPLAADHRRIAALEEKIEALEEELQTLKRSRRERDLAEWLDVVNSPSALRYLAELQEPREQAIRERREREEQERERWKQEWRRQCEMLTRGTHTRATDLAVMGLPHDAGAAQVRARYTALMMDLHPDRNGGDRAGEERMRAVMEAYERLKKANRHEPGASTSAGR
jgi:hypothetical protein